MKHKILELTRHYIRTKYALIIFAILVYIEAFFFMPVNTLMTFYGVEWPRRSFLLASIATIGSVLGGMTAYGIGYALRTLGLEHALFWLISPERFNQIAQTYAQHETGTVFIISLLPIPLKVVTLTAGFFQLPFFCFIGSLFLARIIRFFTLGGALYIWGDKIHHLIDRYFYIFIGLAIATFIIMLWYLH